MRDIKFRAWDKQYKKMVNVTFINFDTNEIDHSDNLNEPKSIDHFELMQFTGVSIPLEFSTEKVDIYSGDIIALHKDEKEYFRGVVTDHGHAGYTIDSDSDYMEFMLKGYTYRKLGDKFSNPELLRQTR